MNQKAGSHWTQILPGPPSVLNFLVSKTVCEKDLHCLQASRLEVLCYSRQDGLKQCCTSVSSCYVFEKGVDFTLSASSLQTSVWPSHPWQRLLLYVRGISKEQAVSGLLPSTSWPPNEQALNIHCKPITRNPLHQPQVPALCPTAEASPFLVNRAQYRGTGRLGSVLGSGRRVLDGLGATTQER